MKLVIWTVSAHNVNLDITLTTVCAQVITLISAKFSPMITTVKSVTRCLSYQEENVSKITSLIVIYKWMQAIVLVATTTNNQVWTIASAALLSSVFNAIIAQEYVPNVIQGTT